MIREVSRKGRTSDLARYGQGDTTSRNAEETQQQSKLNRAPRTDAMHPKCPPAARQLSGALCDVLCHEGLHIMERHHASHPSHTICPFII